MTPRDDSELLAAFVATRDETAFAALVDCHLGMVYGCARRQVTDPHLAEDVAQAVFILLAKKAHTIRSGGQLPGWLVAAARFCARDMLKRERRRRLREQSAAQTMRPPTRLDSTQQYWEEIAPLLDDALSRLSAVDRSAVALRYLQGRTVAEVAAALRISNDAAEKRISRAIARLRESFSRRDVVLSTITIAEALHTHGITMPPAHLASRIVGAAASVKASGLTKGMIAAIAMVFAMFIGTAVIVSRSAQPNNAAATSTSMPTVVATTQPRNRIKAGVIVSYFSAMDLNARRNEDGYKDQVEMVRALDQKPEVDLYVVIDPGSGDKGEMPNILKKYTTPDHVINGGDVADLKKLDVIVSPRNYLPEDVFAAVCTAVTDGVGLLKTMQLGREGKHDPEAAAALLRNENAQYYWPNRETTARVLAAHPILKGLTEQNVKQFRARPNGYFGIVQGTPLIDAPSETVDIGTPDGKKNVDYCFLYVSQLGKGRIVVGQWLRFPPDLDRATGGRFYIHCLQWLANRPVQ